MTSNGYDLAHPADLDGETSYTFTCGKIDAGIAVLIGSHAHLIEFPSLLLPPGCEPGSIVSITCARDQEAEKSQAKSFWDLQNKIFNQFGLKSPQPPVLRLRSVTQTSVTLEWDKLDLAQSKLLALSIWKNGQRLGPIPNPVHNTSSKLSGLELDTEYSFNLVMKTTGGTFNSKIIKVKTHSLNDTSGINVCFGIVLPEEILEQSKQALEQLNGRWTDKIQIDTTHFVCIMSHHPPQHQNKNAQPSSFPSLEYQRALQLSIPIVQPTWLLACLAERKMVPIAAHYLGAQPPNLRSISLNGSNTSLPTGKTTKMPSNPPATPPFERLPLESNSTPVSPAVSGNSAGPIKHTRAGSAAPSITLPQANNEKERRVSGDLAASGLPIITESTEDGAHSIVNQPASRSTAGKLGQAQLLDSRASNQPSSSTGVSTDPTTSPVAHNSEQPSIPPSRQPGISDILNEIVDAPENDSFQPAITPPYETTPIQQKIPTPPDTKTGSPPRATNPSSDLLAPSGSGLSAKGQFKPNADENEDDPFSAASPTSQLSPYLDRDFKDMSLNLSSSISTLETPVDTEKTAIEITPSFDQLGPSDSDSVAETLNASATDNVPSTLDDSDGFEDVSMSGNITPKNLGRNKSEEFSTPLDPAYPPPVSPSDLAQSSQKTEKSLEEITLDSMSLINS